MSPHAPGGGGASGDPPAPAARPTIGKALWRAPGGLSTPAAAAAIGVLGAITYTLLRAASDQFYAPLGLSPEDVGLGQAELLGRALGAFLLPLIFAVLLLALWAEVVGLREFGRAVDKAQRGRFGAAVSVAGVLLLVVMITAPAVGVALLVVPVLGFGIFGLWHTSMSAGLVRVVGVVVALLAVLGTALLVLAAQSSTDHVRDGRGLIGLDRFALPWEASVVELRWLGGPQSQPTAELMSGPPDELPCAVYLGAHDGFVVLVNPRVDTTVRLPAGGVTLTTFTATDDEYPVCDKTGVMWKEFDPPER
jgi:hypothetical protein